MMLSFRVSEFVFLRQSTFIEKGNGRMLKLKLCDVIVNNKDHSFVLPEWWPDVKKHIRAQVVSGYFSIAFLLILAGIT